MCKAIHTKLTDAVEYPRKALEQLAQIRYNIKSINYFYNNKDKSAPVSLPGTLFAPRGVTGSGLI